MAPGPPAPTLKYPGSGAAIGDLAVTLQWNPSTGAATYSVQVAKNYGFTDSVVTYLSMDTSYNLSGLDWTSRYYWRVNAVDSAGSPSRWSAYRYFRTPVGPPPSNLVATTFSATQINLTWQDNSTGEAGFKIERSTNGGVTYSQIATVGADQGSYSSTGLRASTTYYYRVRAYQSTLYSAYTDPVAYATTLPPPPPVPTLKSPLRGTVVSGLSVTLEWNVSTDAATYGVQVSRNSTFTDRVFDQSNIGVTSYPVNVPDWNMIYYWRVNATNADSSTSRWSTPWYFRTPGP